MNVDYWDEVSSRYDDRIFDVLNHDKKSRIKTLIASHFNHRKNAIAADYGCGTGKFLNILLGIFNKVYAYDLSLNNIRLVDEQFLNDKKLHTSTRDFSTGLNAATQMDFILSVNVMIMDDLKTRWSIMQTIVNDLKPSGHALIIVPSLESALYTSSKLIEWNIKEGIDHDRANSIGFDRPNTKQIQTIREGVVDAGGIPTKHYIKEELISLCRYHHVDVLTLEKLEYDWSTEFIHPPQWMQSPYPWDWLLYIKKP